MRDDRRDVVRRGYDEIADRYLAARATGGDVAFLAPASPRTTW